MFKDGLLGCRFMGGLYAAYYEELESGWDYPAVFPFTTDIRVKFENATVIGGGDVVDVYPVGGSAYRTELEEEFQGGIMKSSETSPLWAAIIMN